MTDPRSPERPWAAAGEADAWQADRVEVDGAGTGNDPGQAGGEAPESGAAETAGGPGGGAAGEEPPGTDYHQSSLWRWRGSHSLIGGALFALFGLLLVAGAQAYRSGDVLENARPADLVRILASLESENDRLAQEQRQLEAELADLQSGTQEQAISAARARLEALQVLAGTTAVRGPGIRVVIRDPESGLDAPGMLDAIQELRDAGAESIELAQVRVVVDTWFGDPADATDTGILISGQLRHSPYTILAIGDPQTLGTALQIPGGVVDTVESGGGRVEIDRRDELDITSTVPFEAPEYAEPASAG